MAVTTLYRPAGERELALIRESGWREFPPRPSEELEEFNRHIVGLIEIMSEFRGAQT